MEGVFSVMIRTICVIVFLMIGSVQLFADRMPSNISGWWISPGLTASRILPSSNYIGCDVSIIRMGNKLQYGGMFADAGYTAKEKGPRLISGIEMGFAVIGVDAGFLCQRYKGNNGFGYSVRPYLSIPFYATFNIFGRRNRVRSSGQWSTDYEFGIQVKYPLKLR